MLSLYVCISLPEDLCIIICFLVLWWRLVSGEYLVRKWYWTRLGEVILWQTGVLCWGMDLSWVVIHSCYTLATSVFTHTFWTMKTQIPLYKTFNINTLSLTHTTTALHDIFMTRMLLGIFLHRQRQPSDTAAAVHSETHQLLLYSRWHQHFLLSLTSFTHVLQHFFHNLNHTPSSLWVP